ncbi:HAMP domain-containing histidine kinase [Marinobacterium sp. AK62]|uniref:histidine kinase n=1 Tax=Marinobacterium alkalitolerans TaxID=1542925 RepID=A0ABS3Z701_9GAMM|nr:HAMP domain-containing sensor histidine kinase [Marinobacterium alkalitolerans]MBP0047483.1 HAMP domain-containing histidine kinase [Marinobacterium alkalitolerans]
MFSRLIKARRINTALELTLKFTLLFFISALVLFITVDSLLHRAQQDKDQQLISSFLESYQRLEQTAGLHKLDVVVERDTPYFQRSDMWLELTDDEGERLLHVQPEQWSPTQSLLLPAMQDGEWAEGTFGAEGSRFLVGQISLDDNARLRIGKSLAHRAEQQAEYRKIILIVMLPLLGVGLLLAYYMNWRALRQVKDLAETVRNLKTTDLDARVPVRNPHTELGELAQLFNTMLIQISRLIRGMQHSLDAVAHDLRTPLARMRLSIESAVGCDDVKPLREALLDCAEENARIEGMLKTLMDISEAESGILTLHPEPIDLYEAVKDCVELYRYAAEDRGVRLQVEGQPVTVNADRVRVHQVLCNLIDNAIKYNKPGGDVHISLNELSASAEVVITDEGAGIDPSEMELVFNRLYRGNKSRSEPGVGLGLSLVKAIVEAHDGSITIAPPENKGCKISVVLPRLVK